MKHVRRTMKWIPRIVTLLLIIFICLFSFDVFTGNDPWYKMILGFIIHCLPVMFLLLVWFISIYKPWVGATIYSVFGLLFFLWMAIEQSPQSYAKALYFGIPFVVVSILYLLDYKARQYEKTGY
ncbi:hypothetical protein N7603_05760 [Acholeplasma vituli]|uniref:DUF7670 domain-containing protein n=1 Tax=Paracholeplasma vituli TaxID=69473 RepID=A0ABT2PZR9_9MOLU|nr:hypothetical protein [Paracholeplasma vituli]MCU0105158.1 hypothetical protein [Paracholeplasma vituli]